MSYTVVLFSFMLLIVQSLASYDYDHLTFTQQWPQGVCECTNGLGVDEACRIPQGVKTWTIHGIWPTRGTTEEPQFCNHTWQFDEGKILDIEEQMKIFWPKLIFKTSLNSLFSEKFQLKGSRISFWEHEWEKHGTCCTDLPILNSEHKYFDTGLNLNRKFDLSSMLNDAGITPSKNKTYKLDDIRNAVGNTIKTKPYLHCCKADGIQYIQELMICFNKQLSLIDCPEDDEDCSDDVPVAYKPLYNTA